MPLHRVFVLFPRRCRYLSNLNQTVSPMGSQCDAKNAYRSKTTWEIIRSLFVLEFCKHGWLVDHSEKFIKVGKKMLGQKIFNKIMKASFFGQFVAGENEEEIRPLIERLREFHVSIILNYAVEDDEQGGGQEKSGLIKHEENKRKDPRDKNMQSFLKTIDLMAETTKGEGFAAIKVTALSTPETLMTVTNIIRKSHAFVNNSVDEKSDQRPIVGRGLQKTTLFENVLRKHKDIQQSSLEQWTDILEINGESVIDAIRWKETFTGEFTLDDISFLPNSPRGIPFKETEKAEFAHLLRRIETIAKHANQTKMRVLVDAEQSYFQPAISRLSLELMRMYNKDHPSIYNTYQCYLKSTFQDVAGHSELARKENFMFGAKVVRGAYILLERQRAIDMGYMDPINPTFEATTTMYKQVVSHILQDVKSRGDKTHIVIAGHNENTVKWAVQQLEHSGHPRRTRQIYFGQLLGMCDHLSFTLADAGYNVVKCVPYGSVDEVLPYLVRRAHENRGVMEKTTKERLLMRREFFRRIRQKS